MVLTFDEVGERLDAMAEEFPPVFYRELNGGISLLPEAVEDPEFPPGEIYIMGEYCDDQMGRYIQLFCRAGGKGRLDGGSVGRRTVHHAGP